MTTIRLESLTGLRGILALLVVIAHGVGRVGWYEAHPDFKPLFIAFGHFGVVGFFILSGFILKSVYDGRHWTIREFAVNRFARIYPLYLACLLFTLPLDWLTPGFPTEGRLEALGLSLSLQQSWFEFSNGRFNGPGWTLGVEFFFYAMFPLLFALRVRYSKLFLVLFLVLLVTTAWFWDPNKFHLAHRVPHMRLWEFVLGILAADVFKKKLRFTQPAFDPTGIAFAVLLIGIFGGCQIHHWIDWPFFEWIVMAGSALVMILSLAMADTVAETSPILARPLLILAGEISYGVYLIHDGIQRYGKVAIERVSGTATENLPIAVNLTFILISIIASFICAYFLWRFLEKPARDYFRAVLSPVRSPEVTKSRPQS